MKNTGLPDVRYHIEIILHNEEKSEYEDFVDQDQFIDRMIFLAKNEPVATRIYYYVTVRLIIRDEGFEMMNVHRAYHYTRIDEGSLCYGKSELTKDDYKRKITEDIESSVKYVNTHHHPLFGLCDKKMN